MPFVVTITSSTVAFWLAVLERAVGGLGEGSTLADYWSVARRLSEGARLRALDAKTVVREMMIRTLVYGVQGEADIEKIERALERTIAAYVTERTPEGLIHIGANSDWRIAQSWLFKDLFLSIGVGALIGVSGVGKTFLLLDAMRAVATGEAFGGIEPSLRGGGIVLAGEDVDGMRARRAALHLDLATGEKVYDDLPVEALEAKQLADPNQRKRIEESLWRLAEKDGEKRNAVAPARDGHGQGNRAGNERKRQRRNAARRRHSAGIRIRVWGVRTDYSSSNEVE